MMRSRTASIASHVPGRLRLRHPALGRSAGNAEVVAALARREGVSSAAGNPRTAGVLVLYDAAALSPDEAEAAALNVLASITGPEAAGTAAEDPEVGASETSPSDAIATTRPSARTRFAATYRKVRVPVNIAMLATLGGSLLALGIGRKAHAALGVAHLGVLALHLVQYRRRLVS